MSRKDLWLISHNNKIGNAKLTSTIVVMFRENKLTTKQVAYDLGEKTERVRNWYYRSTKMTALDLCKMMHHYEFIKNYVLESI